MKSDFRAYLSAPAYTGIRFTLVCFDILLILATISLLLPEETISRIIAVPLAYSIAETALRILVLGVISSLISDIYLNAHNTK